MDPKIAMGPMQYSKEAVMKPSTKRLRLLPGTAVVLAFPLLNRFSRTRPRASSPSSIRHHSPSSAPIRRAPRTISAFSVLKNIWIPTTAVNRPIPLITVPFSRSGIRAPKNKPIAPPINKAATLMMVPAMLTFCQSRGLTFELVFEQFQHKAQGRKPIEIIQNLWVVYLAQVEQLRHPAFRPADNGAGEVEGCAGGRIAGDDEPARDSDSRAERIRVFLDPGDFGIVDGLEFFDILGRGSHLRHQTIKITLHL